MKKFVFWLAIFLFLFSATLFFPASEKSSSHQTLLDLSMECWEDLMQSPSAREVFDLEEKEAKEVFGWENEEFFL